ncbi:MAG: GNAT family N-acetyltransferase, partial [Candidatus Tectomicrobia bacterium]|nr:GNAT family N-acetyltransferase [Candidatus Tectomicrobia bacterium]
MSQGTREPSASEPFIVDLVSVDPAELNGLWQREISQWRERLYWEVPGSPAALWRALKSGSVQGKAVRVGGRLTGYAYSHIISGQRGVISAFVIAPQWGHTGIGDTLLHAMLADLHDFGLPRIECPSVSFDAPWLNAIFTRQGFCVYGREFLRIDLNGVAESDNAPAAVELEPWPERRRGAELGEAAVLMQAAYRGGIDAEISELYRTPGGCRMVLQNLMSQSLGGRFVDDASALARHQGQLIGFTVITEIAPQQGHLAQIVVLPAYQGRGVG